MEKIVIALNLIIDYIDTDEIVSEKDITDYLQNTGFDDYEIRQTLSILNFGVYENPEAIRFFTAPERNKISEKAIQYLQKLNLAGMLDFVTLEDIIDKSMDTADQKVDVENIKQITLYTLLEKKSYILKNDYEFQEEDYYIQ
jgi:Smg protein